MADVNSMPGLLINALQDLHDGERAMVDRLPAIADHVSDDGLRALLDEDAINSAEQQRRIANLISRHDAEIDGAPNIWLRAILDDADRDTENVEKGNLLDIALVGAIRKAKQAERVSYETAMALAANLGGADTATLEAIRDEEAAADGALADCLVRLTAPEN
jgi:ferritin-like metal-binding protein YciE